MQKVKDNIEHEGNQQEKFKLPIPPKYEHEVLELGDSLHQGYFTALKRLERWCWFPQMEAKVRS